MSDFIEGFCIVYKADINILFKSTERSLMVLKINMAFLVAFSFVKPYCKAEISGLNSLHDDLKNNFYNVAHYAYCSMQLTFDGTLPFWNRFKNRLAQILRNFASAVNIIRDFGQIFIPRSSSGYIILITISSGSAAFSHFILLMAVLIFVLRRGQPSMGLLISGSLSLLSE